MSALHNLAVWALPVTLAITVHEAAHGYAARSCGDDTAARAGRLSLNPLRHIDPVGTVLVPAVLLLLGGFLFGWAKPVPINPALFRQPRRDMAWVAAAGPLSNGVMLLLWLLVYGMLAHVLPAEAAAVPAWQSLALSMAVAGALINLALMLLNLLPVPPLDGGRILRSLLPPPLAAVLDRIEPYGLLILLALIASGWLLPMLLQGPQDWLLELLQRI